MAQANTVQRPVDKAALGSTLMHIWSTMVSNPRTILEGGAPS